MKIKKSKTLKNQMIQRLQIIGGKKTTQHRNVSERCVTLKRIICGYSQWNFADSFRYCKKKKKKKIQILKLSKGQKILMNIFENSLPINYWNKYIYIYIYYREI